jgi:hypothetical protein
MQGREPVIEGFRLSPQQKRVWRLQRDSRAYQAQCAILIEGDLNSEALEEALKKIVQRHEILRTTLDWFPGLETPIQIILESLSLPLRQEDLSEVMTEEYELSVDKLLNEEARPFDLKGGLLARFCLTRLSASSHVLLISLHTLCGDSWTLKNLFSEIGRFYVEALEGKESSDEPPQYLQFSEWQNELLEEEWKENEGGQEVNCAVSGEEEIVIECLFDGRPFDELRGTLGLFAGYAPARGGFRHGLRFDEAVEWAMSSLQSAADSRQLLLRSKATPRANVISFEYEEWPGPERAGSVKFSYWKQRCCIDRFKLKLGGYRKNDGLMIEMQYDPAIFSRESIELIQERYLTLIENAVSCEHPLIGDLAIVGRKELEKLLVEWNETERRLPESRCLYELITAQAALRSDSIAVIYQEEWLCYRELENRANQLAHHLRSLGVGPDCVVGLYLDRSTEMVIGLLGITPARE